LGLKEKHRGTVRNLGNIGKTGEHRTQGTVPCVFHASVNAVIVADMAMEMKTQSLELPIHSVP